MPLEVSLTRTWSSLGSGISISARVSGSSGPVCTAAFYFIFHTCSLIRNYENV